MDGGVTDVPLFCLLLYFHPVSTDLCKLFVYHVTVTTSIRVQEMARQRGECVEVNWRMKGR
jgi:hypothetical protein